MKKCCSELDDSPAVAETAAVETWTPNRESDSKSPGAASSCCGTSAERASGDEPASCCSNAPKASLAVIDSGRLYSLTNLQARPTNHKPGRQALESRLETAVARFPVPRKRNVVLHLSRPT